MTIIRITEKESERLKQVLEKSMRKYRAQAKLWSGNGTLYRKKPANDAQKNQWSVMKAVHEEKRVIAKKLRLARAKSCETVEFSEREAGMLRDLLEKSIARNREDLESWNEEAEETPENTVNALEEKSVLLEKLRETGQEPDRDRLTRKRY